LLALWRERLIGQLPPMAYEGAAGEYEFIRYLGKIDDGSVLIYRLQQRPSDDLDVTVVGPRGVWVFEVKFWSGAVSWKAGRWARGEKTFRARGGALETQERPIGEPPDQQWRRMVEDVMRTLQMRAGRAVRVIPALAVVHGGLVFSHPQVDLRISGAPFNWGGIRDWMQTYHRAAWLPGLSERQLYEVLDALLLRHRQVSGESASFSMDDYAQLLVQQAEARLVERV
jgi:hypothetical protein